MPHRKNNPAIFNQIRLFSPKILEHCSNISRGFTGSQKNWSKGYDFLCIFLLL